MKGMALFDGKRKLNQHATRGIGSLNLHLLEAVLPDNDVGRSAVLAVVEEDDPGLTLD